MRGIERGLFGVILILQMFVMVWFGMQKQDFHMDEYFSYYSTSDDDFSVEYQDDAWNDSNIIADKCRVRSDSRFNYKNVYIMEGRDVHPPLYYYFLHTVCSLFPGMFTKWTGIGLNIFFFLLSSIILGKITWLLSQKNAGLVLAVSAFYGFNPAVISAVMFIRMYMLLAVFILLFVYIHIWIAQAGYCWNVGSLEAIVFTAFGGFLTHYYFIVFAAIFSVVYAITVLVNTKKVFCTLLVAGAALLGIGLAVLYYPACIEHIFHGYRGEGAQSAFFDLSNTGYRLKYFLNLTSRIAFSGWLQFLLGILALGAVFCCATDWKKKADGWHPSQLVKSTWTPVIVAVLGYYVIVAKTALVNEDEMIRYTFPVYALLFLLMGSGFALIINKLFAAENKKRWAAVLLLAVCMILNVHGMRSGDVLFLYPEKEERIQFASEHAESAVIWMHGNGGWLWEIARELGEYREFYAVSQDTTGKIEDERINNAKEMVAYLDNTTEGSVQKGIEVILESNAQIKEYEHRFSTQFYDIYIFR